MRSSKGCQESIEDLLGKEAPHYPAKVMRCAKMLVVGFVNLVEPVPFAFNLAQSVHQLLGTPPHFGRHM